MTARTPSANLRSSLNVGGTAVLCSVIIPARNVGHVVGECILASLSQTVPRERYEVIVVDDGSTDRTAGVARRLGARVVPRPPTGAAAARNAGARAAKGDIFVFVDPDCVPRVDWLAQMIAPFEAPDVVAVTGAYETHQETLIPRLIQAHFDDVYRRRDRSGTTSVVEGYSAAFRRSAFIATGGFDPALAAADDLELSYRLVKEGRLVFASGAIVLHHHAPTLATYVEGGLRDGLWRSLVYARHPEQLLGHSDAPITERSQVPLAGLVVASALAGTRRPAALRITALAMTAFLATTIPAAWRARRAGADVALASPGFALAGRAATSIGLVVGGVALGVQRLADALRTIGRPPP